MSDQCVVLADDVRSASLENFTKAVPEIVRYILSRTIAMTEASSIALPMSQ